MSKNMNSEKAVRNATQLITDAEARTVTFTKTYQVSGRNKTGTFVFRYPSLMDKVQIGVARAKMFDGAPEQSIDNFTSNIAYMMCYLDKLCVKHPGWFNLETIEDVDVVSDLFKEVTNWCNNFRLSTESGGYNAGGNTGHGETAMAGSETV